MLTFFIAFLQMGLISSQVLAITQAKYLMAFMTSIGISVCWLFNVNKAVKGNTASKIAYVLGAATGTLAAIYLNKLIR